MQNVRALAPERTAQTVTDALLLGVSLAVGIGWRSSGRRRKRISG